MEKKWIKMHRKRFAYDTVYMKVRQREKQLHSFLKRITLQERNLAYLNYLVLPMNDQNHGVDS